MQLADCHVLAGRVELETLRKARLGARGVVVARAVFWLQVPTNFRAPMFADHSKVSPFRSLPLVAVFSCDLGSDFARVFLGLPSVDEDLDAALLPFAVFCTE